MTDPDEQLEHVPTRVLLAGLNAGVNDLVEVAKGLYKASVLSRIERAVVGIVLLGVLVASIASLIAVTKLNAVASQNRANNAYVRECTTPSTATEKHACFEDSQQRTAALIGQLNQATLTAIICADELEGRDAITRCVTDRLAAGTGTQGSSP